LSRLIPTDTVTSASRLSDASATTATALSFDTASGTHSGTQAGTPSARTPLSSLVGVGPPGEEPAVGVIPYSWFGLMFNQCEFAVRFDTTGLTLTSLNINRFFTLASGNANEHCNNSDDKEAERHFSWLQLDKPAVFNWSFFGYMMSFKFGGQVYSTPFLSYGAQSQFSDDISVYWANANQQGLCALVDRVDKALTREYLRQSRLKMITARVAREYARWFPWAQNKSLNRKLPVEVQSALIKLQQFKAWTAEDIVELRERYVQQQLLVHKAFFDKVESNPLTEKQRRACVVDDNNNLLLAGAGTGKTSVMVGRAGYLIASGQAIASEILLLAYGKVAAKEMEARIKLKLGPLLASAEQSPRQKGGAVNDIRVSTFHSLGMRIISEVEGATPKLSAWVNDDKGKERWLNTTLESLLTASRYRKRLLAFFNEHFQIEVSPFAFESEEDYLDYFNANDIRTFKGDRVKSFAELQIANWLFKQGIEYQYDVRYQDNVSDKGAGQYKSNFYLPQYDLYIDYFNIDESGTTPVFIDDISYQARIESRHELHRQNNTHYVNLYHHQHNQGVLLKVLAKALVKYKVKRAPIDDETLLAQLRNVGYITKLVKLFSQVLTLYRGACLDDTSLAEQLSDSTDQKQTEAVFTLIKPILKSYQAHLNTRGEIDFEDMIAKAIQYIEQGQFTSPWCFIMVDEFQDISEPRARLIRALRDSTQRIKKDKPAEETQLSTQSNGLSAALSKVKETAPSGRQASLFCVGDDWQAIYRFSGADVKLITDFEAYFGHATQSHLDLTFRFNSRIGDVATRFVTQNPMQINKTIHSITKGSKSAVSIVKGSAANTPFDDATHNTSSQKFTKLIETLDAITQIVAKGKSTPGVKPTVYLLARYWFMLPDQQQLALLNQASPSINIECQSFHASKGKEADYVIIMGLTTGVHGFPSLKTTPPVLDALLPEAEDFNFAEERRLFYVALTRAKHKVYLLADMKDASPFVHEVAQY